MNTILVSDKIYSEKIFNEGFESKLYLKEGILYKIFKTEDKSILKNKIEKLEILKSYKMEDINPLDFIQINGKIKGYTMLPFKDSKPLDIFLHNKKEKLRILKIILEKISILHQKHIIFGDINISNILIQNGQVHFCDYDNYKVENFNFDITNCLENIYLSKLEADEYLDLYMFNLLTISYLKRIYEPYTLIYLKNGLPIYLDTIQNRNSLQNMFLLENKEEITPFIEHTKRYHLF